MPRILRIPALGASPFCQTSKPTCRCCKLICSAKLSESSIQSNTEQPNNLHAPTHLLQCAALIPLLCTFPAVASEVAEQVVVVGSQSGYIPSPMETPSWEIWVGFVAGVVPFIIASYEFGKRIVIQRRCPECQGRGLVQRGRVLKKCAQVSERQKLQLSIMSL